jgi:cytoskeletal protein RodZ
VTRGGVMRRDWRPILGRSAIVALLVALAVAGFGAAKAAADQTPSDTQYTNPASTEPTTPPTQTESSATTAQTESSATTAEESSTSTTSTAEESTNKTDTGSSESKPAAVAVTTNGTEPTSTAGSDNSLPFTGMNLIVLLGVGGALMFAGLALRRAGRRDGRK